MKEFLKKLSSISTLAGVVLVVLAFCPRGNNVATVFLILFVVAWAAVKLSLWVWAKAQAEAQAPLAASQRKLRAAQARKASKHRGTCVRRADGSEFEIPDLDHDLMSKEDPGRLLLSSVNNHISDMLQNFYPGATWTWQCSDPLEQIVSGDVARIRLLSVPECTEAEVSFADPAKMDIRLIHVERLGHPVKAPVTFPDVTAGFSALVQNDKLEAAADAKPQETDVNVWYSMIGQHALEQIITDLNVRGCRKLSIDESGDVYAAEEGKEAKKEMTLDRMPATRYWEDLKRLLKEQDLTASIEENRLVVGW